MMYVKPEFMVEEFGLNESIALCDPEEVTASVVVHCLKTNKHEIFESQCDSKYSEMETVTYAGQEYLVWGQNAGDNIKCDKSCTQCDENSTLFNQVVANTSADAMDHIAPIDGELKTLVNFSQ